VKNAPTPTNGTTTLWDTEVTGFEVRVYAGGTRSFFLNYRLNGSETRYTIGKWPDWWVEAARDEARTQRKRMRREAATMRDLIDRYMADHLGPMRTCSEYDKRAEGKRAKFIGKCLGLTTKVGDVHDGDIERIHRAITAKGIPSKPTAAIELIEGLRKSRKKGAQWVFAGQKPGEPLQQLWRSAQGCRSHAAPLSSEAATKSVYSRT
jgi:hypothetical protein